MIYFRRGQERPNARANINTAINIVSSDGLRLVLIICTQTDIMSQNTCQTLKNQTHIQLNALNLSLITIFVISFLLDLYFCFYQLFQFLPNSYESKLKDILFFFKSSHCFTRVFSF